MMNCVLRPSLTVSVHQHKLAGIENLARHREAILEIQDAVSTMDEVVGNSLYFKDRYPGSPLGVAEASSFQASGTDLDPRQNHVAYLGLGPKHNRHLEMQLDEKTGKPVRVKLLDGERSIERNGDTYKLKTPQHTTYFQVSPNREEYYLADLCTDPHPRSGKGETAHRILREIGVETLRAGYPQLNRPIPLFDCPPPAP